MENGNSIAMNEQELLAIIQGGESSKVQFKERLPHLDTLAHELIAFSNSQGGIILFGINDKTGKLNGLSFAEIQQLNQQLVNTASQKVYPPVYLITETIPVQGNNIVVVTVNEGGDKPYKDSNGTIYVKNGADKRKVTSNDEIARLLQSRKSLYADESLINGSSINDIDLDQFNSFILRKYKKSIEDLNIDVEKILANLDLCKNDLLNLTCLLLFSKKRHLLRPQFSIQCVSIDGPKIENTFIDSEGIIDGTIPIVFQRTMDFIDRNMKKVPETTGFNSPTKWEIPYEVFEELIVNALVHRDYYISSTIKVIIYSNRVEIISPGKLPNSLTIENIKNGVSIARNPILLSTAQFILPYKGLGTGIIRSYNLYPEIIMENDIVNNQFKVVIKRKT
ncbi:RNA-binding domain-containing protein [Leadbettera azotonutricia]|uniref:ATP-dependent DNA helicase n=1 Tax=Leadbettera azotonutricia (strain ATCC BAA-888 / DSM 13862 / ZAS-9) TaxID=545695 RepID=F5YAW2_LEAAZ|nr:RNA-binding domain-containing protein [Leadbettera azotonutricia]AEF80157.1 ATP-dependent DNA helicase [Leadbettera azotonutricia ZAS-9]